MLLSEIFSYENKNTYRLCDINTNRGNRLIGIGGLARIYIILVAKKNIWCSKTPHIKSCIIDW